MIVISETDEVTVQLDLETLVNVGNFVDKLIARANTNLPHLITNWFDSPDKMRNKMVIRFVGEKAVAEYLDAPHVFDLTLEKGHGKFDIDGVEVRSVEEMSHCLITHDYDKPAPYVLAVVNLHVATVVLRGWLHLAECNNPKRWRTDVPRAAYFTPGTVLHPMDTLRTYYTDRKRR